MNPRTWFITGAGSGLGYAITKLLLEQGDRVAATTKQNFTDLNILQKTYGDQLWLSTLDVTDHDAITKVVEAAFAYFGTIETLISNAGQILLGALEEVSYEQIMNQLELNLIAPVFLIKSFVPYLRKQGGGQIIQISSEAGQMTYPALSAYHAAKWGIEGFCDSLARELIDLNIFVTLVEPGRFETQFDQNAQVSQTIIADYQKTTVGNYRRLIAMGKFPPVSEVNKNARTIIDTARQNKPPLRLALGKDAYTQIKRSLSNRLDALEAQKDLAFSVNLDT